MKRITEITKRDILDLFRNGLEIDEFFDRLFFQCNFLLVNISEYKIFWR